jgi:hypothetical protein
MAERKKRRRFRKDEKEERKRTEGAWAARAAHQQAPQSCLMLSSGHCRTQQPVA